MSNNDTHETNDSRKLPCHVRAGLSRADDATGGTAGLLHYRLYDASGSKRGLLGTDGPYLAGDKFTRAQEAYEALEAARKLVASARVLLTGIDVGYGEFPENG